MRRVDTLGRHAEFLDDLGPDEVRIDDDGLRALEGPRHAAHQPADAIRRVRFGVMQPRQVMDRDDDRHVVAQRDVVRLVVEVDAMLAQPPRKSHLLRRDPQHAAEREPRLDPLDRRRRQRKMGRWRLRRLVPPSIAVERVRIDFAGGRQSGAQFDNVVADARQRRQQRGCIERNAQGHGASNERRGERCTDGPVRKGTVRIVHYRRAVPSTTSDARATAGGATCSPQHHDIPRGRSGAIRNNRNRGAPSSAAPATCRGRGRPPAARPEVARRASRREGPVRRCRRPSGRRS